MKNFDHTIENCFEAKKELLELGFKENDFYQAEQDYEEIGYLVGEPMLKTNDDFCKSALQLIKEKNITEIEEKDIKVKMSLCPECKNAVTVAIEHKMDNKSKKEFMKDVFKYNLDIKTISLQEYRESNLHLGCEENCSQKNII